MARIAGNNLVSMILDRVAALHPYDRVVMSTVVSPGFANLAPVFADTHHDLAIPCTYGKSRMQHNGFVGPVEAGV